MTPLHETLRTTTRALHERAEGAFARFDLARRDGYGEFLQAQGAALMPLEAALDAAGAERLIADWPSRKRGAALAADLTALGLPRLTPQPQPQLAGDDEAFGALYVLEGSKLGARYLLARVSGSDFAQGATAFLGHGEAPERKDAWPVFLQKLAAIPFEPARAAALLAGATAAFHLFERAALAFEKA